MKLPIDNQSPDDADPSTTYSYSVNRTSWAAVLATLGVPVELVPQKILQSSPGAKDWDLEKDRALYAYANQTRVPAGYRDNRNTLHETVRASKLVHDHAMGLLQKQAPNHLWYVMFSAGVNFDRILKDHLVNGKSLDLFRVQVPDAVLNGPGFPHYQLYLKSWDSAPKTSEVACPPTGAELAPRSSDVFSSKGVFITNENPFLAAALCTAGFSFDGSKSSLRRDESGRGHSWRLWFPEDPAIQPREVAPLVAMLKTWLDSETGHGEATVKSAALGVLDGTYENALFAMMYLRNRMKLLAAMRRKDSQIILTAPGAVVQRNPLARDRIVQVAEAAFMNEADETIKFFKRERK
jgi:hypothetical protein